jgi:hypothetical protein
MDLGFTTYDGNYNMALGTADMSRRRNFDARNLTKDTKARPEGKGRHDVIEAQCAPYMHRC